MARLVVSFMQSRSQSTLYPGKDPNFPIPSGYNIRSEYVAIGATSARTTLAALASDNFVRLKTDVDCWIKVGDDTVAATALTAAGNNTSLPLAADETIDLDIDEGAQIAVIAA